MKSTRYLFTKIGVMELTILLLVHSPLLSCAQGQHIDGVNEVVAMVNGNPVYEEQLEPEIEKGLRKFRKFGMQNEDAELMNRLKRLALDKVIGEELLFQESRKLKIVNINEQVNRQLMALKEKYISEQRFKKLLDRKDLTIADIKRSLKARIYLDEYLKTKGILVPHITEDRIRKAYEKNKKAYSREESIKVSHILIAVDQTEGALEDTQAVHKAEKIHEELLAGKDFSEMAQKYSDCNSASGGGNLNFIKKGYMPESFDQVAFAMEEETVSEVVKTEFGYHIIKVHQKNPAGVPCFEEVRGFIGKYLQQQESKKKLAAHIAELKKKAQIEIFGDRYFAAETNNINNVY